MRWADTFLDLLYPKCCPGCGKKTEKEKPWCEACIRSFWSPRMLAGAGTRHLDGCYTLTLYSGGIRSALIRLKYGGKREIGASFGQLLSRFPWWERLTGYTLAVPVPLHAARKKARGYNQTDLIFERPLKALGKEYDPDLLVRIRHTDVQSRLDLDRRRANVKGAFHVNRGREIRGASILLVDDIYTTGATLHEAARELKRAGAAHVMGLTLSSGSV